ncbi:MAG: GNAT family N-acetyltransferase, partial [Luminiphilus sp.]
MSIREATLNDVEAISPLFDAYRVFYEQTSDLDGAAQCLKENLSCQRSHVFVFEDNETVLGFTQLYPAFCSVAMQPF